MFSEDALDISKRKAAQILVHIAFLSQASLGTLKASAVASLLLFLLFQNKLNDTEIKENRPCQD